MGFYLKAKKFPPKLQEVRIKRTVPMQLALSPSDICLIENRTKMPVMLGVHIRGTGDLQKEKETNLKKNLNMC